MNLQNVVAVVSTTILIGFYCAIVGLAAQVLTSRFIKFPKGLGLPVGLGLGISSLATVWAHVLTGNALAPIWPLFIFGLMVLVVAALMEIRRQLTTNDSVTISRQLANYHPFAFPDLAAAALVILVMLPVSNFGLTHWTSGTADFPSYAASAEIWENSPKIFLQKHPDAFGLLQVERASYEKPIVTAMLLMYKSVTGLPAYLLLTPSFAISLFVLFASLFTIIRHRFQNGYILAITCVLIPSFSIVPISRVYDAQLGQVVSVSFCACLFAFLTGIKNLNSWQAAVLTGAFGAVLSISSAGSNFTLIAGSSITLVATSLWLLYLSGNSKYYIQSAAWCAIFSFFAAVPMLKMFLTSFTFQTTGEPGFDIPFALSLSLLGQQPKLFIHTEFYLVFLSWISFFILIFYIIYLLPIKKTDRFAFVAFMSSIIINILIISIKLGLDNYAVHKWLALLISLVIPIIFAYLTSRLHGRQKFIISVAMAALAFSSVTIGMKSGNKVSNVVKDDLLSLAHDEWLSHQTNINLQLGNIYDNSIAALLVPSASSTVVQRTYAKATRPSNGPFIVKRTDTGQSDQNYTHIFNDTYAATSNLFLDSDSIVKFSRFEPLNQNFLFGNWSGIEDWGVWSGTGDNFIIFDLPNNRRSKNLNLEIIGNAYTDGVRFQEVEFFLNGDLAATKRYPADTDQPIRLEVNKETIASANGRIVLNVKVKNSISPANSGSADSQNLGFGLVRIEIE